MSQHRRALETIERESGVAGLILRPLSATLLEPTIPEREGWVDRGKLPSIKGRSRREQIGLAEEMGINDYPCPAGGCLLTDRNFSERLRDYFEHTPAPRAADIPLLKVGRHFRMPSGDKVVVARNAGEGESLTALVRDDDYLLVPQEFSGPVVLLRGCGVEEAIAKLLEYTKHEIPPAGAVQILHRKETAVRKL